MLYQPKAEGADEVVFLHWFSRDGPPGDFKERVRRKFAFGGSSG